MVLRNIQEGTVVIFKKGLGILYPSVAETFSQLIRFVHQYVLSSEL